MLLRRIAQGALSLVLLTVFVFFAIRTIPGDPAILLGGPNASPADVDRIRALLGLDRPILEQFFLFVQNALQGNLGTSIVTRTPVSSEIAGRLIPTLTLIGAGMLLAALAGLLGGLIAAARRGKPTDGIITVIAVTLTSMPAFWFALLLVELFAVRLGWFPSSGRGGLAHLVLPAIVLAATQVGLIQRVTRSAVLEVRSADYVRTARAKGLSPNRVWTVHTLRNALIPSVTIIGLQAGLLLGGAVVTETVFNWRGIGQLLVTAVANRDYPVIQALTLLFGAAFVIVNILVDLVNAAIDPQLRGTLR